MPMRMKDEQKDKALHVQCKGWISADIGKRLFGEVYVDVAAIAVQQGRGEAKVRIFDPASPAKDALEREWPEGARIALYSNHYQHSMEPTEDDLRNLAALPEGTALYIVQGSHCKRWKGTK